MAHEQRKTLNLTSVKKRLEDYEQMLQYYIIMRTNNKIKDFEVKLEEWWEVANEYFTKEMEKNRAQHRADENIFMYKLEAYQKNFPDFIYGNPTSKEVLGHDEGIEAGPNGIAQEEEVKTEEPQDLKSGTLRKKKWKLKNHRTS